MGFTKNKGQPEPEEGFPPNSPSSPCAVGKEAEKVRWAWRSRGTGGTLSMSLRQSQASQSVTAEAAEPVSTIRLQDSAGPPWQQASHLGLPASRNMS